MKNLIWIVEPDSFPKCSRNLLQNGTVNWKNLINHWSIYWVYFKDSLCYQYLSSTEVVCWFITARIPMEGEGTVFTDVCLSTRRVTTPSPSIILSITSLISFPKGGGLVCHFHPIILVLGPFQQRTTCVCAGGFPCFTLFYQIYSTGSVDSTDSSSGFSEEKTRNLEPCRTKVSADTSTFHNLF